MQILGEVRAKFGFALVGYVVMPEHIHLLISEPPEGSPSQSRFYDFNVWSMRKKNEKVNYMHMNAVRRGLVRNPNQWAWSSYRAYMKTGTALLSVDTVE